MGVEADFSGYATKANLKCSDGRTITPDAFKHQDKTKVPLVWQHAHNEPSNVLGHAVLENRADGVYCYGYFNTTDSGQSAKQLVLHEDINSLSIYANRLVEKGKDVVHGVIREVSLVLAGANPGALIDFVNLAHADGSETPLDDEAIIYSGQTLEHADAEKEEETVEADVEHADKDKTAKDVFESFTDEQKTVVYYLLSEALKGDSAKHSGIEHADDSVKTAFESFNEEQKNVVYFMLSEAIAHSSESVEEPAADDVSDEKDDESAADADNEDDNSAAHADHQEGLSMTNVFETEAAQGTVKTGTTLTHAQQAEIFKAAARGGSLKDAVEHYATNTLQHGIDDIDVLFPDARAVTSTPDFIKRRTEWVARVMTGTRHTPFARIKSMTANLTLEEARAKGYIKGTFKKEEFFRVAKRVTTPQTIYKKQKLDRDDIVDITDFDVVAWLKGEMRLMLEEEIARAVLLGDGRSASDEDKINEENVRPIATDNDLYVTKLYLNLSDGGSTAEEIVEAAILNRRHYRGSGNPTFFTSETVLAQLLLVKDAMQRRVYSTVADVAAALRVSEIVTVEIMDDPANTVLGIMVNLQDYTIGADRGGDVALFDDFDIDYNQYKYLIETRISGALTKAKAAVVFYKVAASDTLVFPVAPAWNATNKTVTVANTAGIVYKNKLSNQTLTNGSPVPLTEGDELRVVAVPTAGNYLSSNASDEFLYTYDRGPVDAGIN